VSTACSGRAPADAIAAYVGEQGLTVQWILETHVHADHLSAAPYLQGKLGGKIGIGAQITVVQDVFGKVFNAPACMTYVIGDAAFVGDTLFMPDFGTARCDFPGGSAADLYASIQSILALPDATRIFVGHDYKAPGRDDFAWETTVGAQKAQNVHLTQAEDAAAFTAMREARDATLGMPKLIIPSLQVNMRAGNMPEPDADGDVYLKVPVNKL